ncbi:synapsin-1-like [Acinonyx jubatus]|uniref:Synapsin-1-like n=1 Tax=Acinonyx jubatus TaxID=32536 RepID=A0ABM3PQ10_ACIJB|nr:synapsin-1-like [Acinonyx jubatus]
METGGRQGRETNTEAPSQAPQSAHRLRPPRAQIGQKRSTRRKRQIAGGPEAGSGGDPEKTREEKQPGTPRGPTRPPTAAPSALRGAPRAPRRPRPASRAPLRARPKVCPRFPHLKLPRRARSLPPVRAGRGGPRVGRLGRPGLRRGRPAGAWDPEGTLGPRRHVTLPRAGEALWRLVARLYPRWPGNRGQESAPGASSADGEMCTDVRCIGGLRPDAG